LRGIVRVPVIAETKALVIATAIGAGVGTCDVATSDSFATLDLVVVCTDGSVHSVRGRAEGGKRGCG
jgi:hypothetical protein